jgi:hypothetical protein
VIIAGRFNGPPDSANGGYTCGLVAGALGGPVEVTLRSPPPLDRELALTPDEDGGATVRDGDTVVAEARIARALEGEPPAAIDPRGAGEAACRGYGRWSESHPFPTCFVCGPEREPGDGLRVFPGALDDGGDTFAASWTPDEDLADEGGVVGAPYVWASLDCPTSAPVANYGDGPPIVLARFTARLTGAVLAAQPHAIVSWPIAAVGRKRTAASALFDAGGTCLARAEAVWIELRPGSELPGA